VRRAAALVAVAAVAGVGAAALLWSRPGPATGRFDVIFDDARGLVAGQVVKIAGAQAGTIQNVVVTSDFKARIEATVQRRFLPFHQDATCTIRPEALVAENYLECDPGTAASPPLRGSDGRPPTVPVTRTTEPVSLLDLFNIFNLPTRQRLTVLINELGIATAGRGQDVNQILLRANPTLGLARRAIAILTRQRAQLRTLIDATNTVIAQAAAHREGLRRFLDAAAGLGVQLAGHAGPLAESVRRLPALLSAARPALRQLDAVAVQGTPVLAQLRAAAPELDRVAADLGPFAAAATPALGRLATALTRAIPAIRQSVPLLDAVDSYAARSLASTELVGALYPNLQRHGFSEYFLSVMYYVAASLARFDSTSHILPLLIVAPNDGRCGNYATTPVPGCSAHYGSQPPYKPERSQALAALAAYLVK
jgi:ABC-type transporter Mla subunit MlaD